MIETIDWALSTRTIREQSRKILELTCEGKTHFKVNLEHLDKTTDYVIEVSKELYPGLKIPDYSRWRHFTAGNINRPKRLFDSLQERSKDERARIFIDLTIVSVLLDAGAGAKWVYIEEGKKYSRSEGLAVASFNMFETGLFSSNPQNDPYRVDANRLRQLSIKEISKAFQVSSENPMNGVEGRAILLQKIGNCLQEFPEYFGDKNQRPGNLYDYFSNIEKKRCLEAVDVLKVLQVGIGKIWPGRIEIDGFNIGDAWFYSPWGEGYDAIVPFHKLSQWMTYSLLEPLKISGLNTKHNDELTALAEYRNGGLLLDTNLIELKDTRHMSTSHKPGSEIIIEWRALTIELLDQIAQRMREKLNMSPEELPLQSVWEGGTWWAGRKLAFARRGGLAELSIESDGTVF